MTNQQLEAWVHAIIERVLNRQPIEDARVELKADWPADFHRAARQIAGHANAARGAPVLWLIGIDENGHNVTGATHTNIADWWPQVQSYFDALAPSLCSLNVPHDGRTVAAMLFGTDRPPYVVNNIAGGQISREVPWRGATRLDSAKRVDLLCRKPGVV